MAPSLPLKKKRKCGLCRMEGHTKPKCPQNPTNTGGSTSANRRGNTTRAAPARVTAEYEETSKKFNADQVLFCN